MSRTHKKRTNISVDAATLDRARALGVNVSDVSDAALRRAVSEAEGRAWQRENAAALTAHRAWVEENGPPLATWQVLKLPG